MEYLQTTEGVPIFSLVVIIISLIVLHEIIKSASRGKKIHIEAQKQTRLLMEIAKKDGVHEGTINEIVDEVQYKQD